MESTIDKTKCDDIIAELKDQLRDDFLFDIEQAVSMLRSFHSNGDITSEEYHYILSSL